MRRHLASKALVSIVLLASFSLPPVTFSQERVREDIRPRRTQAAPPPQASANLEWRAPASESTASIIQSAVPAPGPDTQIRIALGIDVRSATVSSTGRLLQATGDGSTLVALDVARVRLEPRLLSPLPPITSEN